MLNKKIKKILENELENIFKSSSDIAINFKKSSDYCILNPKIKKNIYKELGYCKECPKMPK